MSAIGATRSDDCWNPRRAVLRDVGDPELVWARPGEHPVHEIIGRDDASKAFGPDRTGEPVYPGLVHELEHGLVADSDAHCYGQLGMDAAVPVSAARGDVHLPDQSGQPLPAQLRLGQRLPLDTVVMLPGDPEDAAAAVDRDPGVGESVDHREQPFGRGRSSSRNFAACRTISNSVSSSRMRRLAARSSADSDEVTPGRRPLSMSSWRIQLERVTGWIPSSTAVCLACLPHARARQREHETPADTDGA